jgi:hypothetical protein
MIRGAPAILLAVAIGLAPFATYGQEPELDRIPAETPAQAAPAVAAAVSKQVNYLSDAFSVIGARSDLAVPVPAPTQPSWENWLFLDSRDEWTLAPGWRLHYSGRLNFRASNGLDFPDHDNVRNDLRELFLEWSPTDRTWLEIGRVNLRSGVALGFNPTDFFRSRTVIDPLTADPSVLREDRLGTLMITGQALWRFGSITVAYAPKVTRPTAIYTARTEPSFDPVLDRTNAEDRILVKTSLRLADWFNPEILYYHAGNRTQFGTNLTAPVGRDRVVYLEWSGGTRPDLIADAFRYGVMTGTLPASAASLLPNSAASRFMNDLSLGMSYATENRMTFNLEYHLHEAGFTARDWRNWFDAHSRAGYVPGVNAALWYLRSYAQDQQEPMSRHSLFFRVEWDDAFVRDLNLTALATVSLLDASGFVQIAAEYHLSSTWTLAALASASYGGRETEYGSLPSLGNFLLRASRYF